MVQYENSLWMDSFVNRTQQAIYSCYFWSPIPSRTGSYGRCQVSTKILVNHVYQKSLHKLKLFYYMLCFTKARYRYSYIDGLRVVFWVKSTVRLFFKVRNLKTVWYF